MKQLMIALNILLVALLTACAADEGSRPEADELAAMVPEATTTAPAPTDEPAPIPTTKPTSKPIVVPPAPTTEPTVPPVVPTVPTVPEAPTVNPVYTANVEECNQMSFYGSVTASVKFGCLSTIEALAKYEPNTKIFGYSDKHLAEIIVNMLPNVPENIKQTYQQRILNNNWTSLETKVYQYVICTAEFINSTDVGNPVYGDEQRIKEEAKQYICKHE